LALRSVERCMPPITDDEIDAIILTEVVPGVATQSTQFSDQAQTNRSAKDTIELIGFLRRTANPGNRTRLAATRKGV
jgi:hypothetical protein